ncbi:uncharacterized protein [Drosophila takahashii]|uniref:uncharacterized protein isoform X2 n=1 Tax=Drosophila takahashii TaxID=29030 RepID=UPI003899626C
MMLWLMGLCLKFISSGIEKWDTTKDLYGKIMTKLGVAYGIVSEVYQFQDRKAGHGDFPVASLGFLFVSVALSAFQMWEP